MSGGGTVLNADAVRSGPVRFGPVRSGSVRVPGQVDQPGGVPPTDVDRRECGLTLTFEAEHVGDADALSRINRQPGSTVWGSPNDQDWNVLFVNHIIPDRAKDLIAR
ncbi:hypothetical protein GCM10008995_16070 [Halobellus salinus]|uniref:Uncharacterized protein n=1 Tax=Halobellus salinus TaxID=931585 RepID=A0A830EAI5_9EURY|nr:hypothetical protein GCM10008995_16070 [Halobellus salinus]SMP15336.1 hypothetical protein SAMN06265347_105115 [Halobellus salinus]